MFSGFDVTYTQGPSFHYNTMLNWDGVSNQNFDSSPGMGDDGLQFDLNYVITATPTLAAPVILGPDSTSFLGTTETFLGRNDLAFIVTGPIAQRGLITALNFHVPTDSIGSRQMVTLIVGTMSADRTLFTKSNPLRQVTMPVTPVAGTTMTVDLSLEYLLAFEVNMQGETDQRRSALQDAESSSPHLLTAIPLVSLLFRASMSSSPASM